MTEAETRAPSVDPAEVARFSAIADEWWDVRGKFAPLHRFNPVRIAYVKNAICRHFGRDEMDTEALGGLSILDIGCGGGLLSVPLARLGGRVTGIDPSETNIAVAGLHAEKVGLDIDFRAVTAEALAETGARFDVVLAMEVVEHVTDVPAFVACCASLVRPGGLMFAATLNRTTKAFLLAIVGAEYVLGWLPRGTHSYAKFVRPEELEAAMTEAGLAMVERTGVTFDPVSGRWARNPRDLDVNYMLYAERPRALPVA